MKKAKRTNNLDDWINVKKIRNERGNLIERATKMHFQEEYENSKGDLKRYWRNIYEIIPKNKDNKTNIHLKNNENVEVKFEDTSTLLNDYFTGIGPKLA